MPRISVKLIAEREAFTNQNFQAGMSLDQANAALVKRYQMKMNPYRLKELFDAINPNKPVGSVTADSITLKVGDLPPAKLVNVNYSDSFKPFVPVVVPASKSNLSFTRVYEATTLSKGGGFLGTVGEVARAIEADKYPIKD
jgi:hypothetical protein